MRTFVGNPTRDMVTLRDMMLSRDFDYDVQCDVISVIVALLYDLGQKNRHFEAVTDSNIFVGIADQVSRHTYWYTQTR